MSSRCGREESLDVVGGLTARKWVHVHNSGTAGWGRSRQMTPRAAATERACRGSMLFPPDPDHDSPTMIRAFVSRAGASPPHASPRLSLITSRLLCMPPHQHRQCALPSSYAGPDCSYLSALTFRQRPIRPSTFPARTLPIAIQHNSFPQPTMLR